MAIEIMKDSKVVQILIAQARKERVESADTANAAKQIQDLAAEPTPHNRYQIAQLVGYTVNDLLQPKVEWVGQIADVKNISFGDRATFRVKEGGLKAFIQAKGAATSRSKISHKQVDMSTIAVSVRPMINFLELKTGRVQMSDLISDATTKMEYAMLAYFQKVLEAAVSTWSAPYYGAGTGLVKATLNPMIRHWHRLGGAALLGDVELTSQFAEMTGFAASSASQQYAPSVIQEYNRTGVIGTYLGCNVVNLVNPYQDDGVTPMINTKLLYILPTGLDTSSRPLKVVYEGDVVATESTNIDDLVYEMRLDRMFGAGVIIGKNPTISVYEDQTT